MHKLFDPEMLSKLPIDGRNGSETPDGLVVDGIEMSDAPALPLSVTTTTVARPDLAVTLTINSTTFFAGSSIDLSGYISNIGSASAGAFSSRIYLSTDTVLGGSDMVLATYNTSSLTTTQHANFSSAATLASNLAPGTYYVGIWADYLGQVSESNENNNAASIAITVKAQPTSYSLTPASTTVAESAGTLTFTITRSGGLPAETIYASTLYDTATSASGDYDPLVNRAVTFAANQTTQTFTVHVNDDNIVESTEHFRVMIGATTSAGSAQALDISDIYITDNDAPQGTSYALSPASTIVTEGGQLVFTITRNGDNPAETIYLSTTQTEGYSNSNDYVGINGHAVSFAAGQNTATVAIQTINDSAPENSETFGLIVQRDAASPASTYLAKSTFTINDDDVSQQPSYSVMANPGVVNENAGTISFTITRTASLGAETVYVSTLNGSTLGYASNNGDYATNVSNLAVSFAAGQSSTTVALAITNDAKAEADETFGLIVQRNATDPLSVFLAKTDWTIHDDDTATASGYAVEPSASHVSESGSIFFTVTRPSGLQEETVYLSTTQDAGSKNDSDYATNLNNYTVHFAAGETQRQVSLAMINDNRPELAETFGVIVQHSASDPISAFLARSTWTIDDDDVGSVTTYQVRPNVGVATSTAGTTITFYVTRSGDLPQETLYANTIAGSEGYSSNNGVFDSLFGTPVAFAAGANSSTTPVSVTLLGGVLDSIGDYLLRLFRGAADQTGLTQTSFSVQPAGPRSTVLNAPTLKLPFDFNQTSETWVTQGFGEDDHGKVDALYPADKYLWYSLDFHALAGTNVLSQGHGTVVSYRDSVTEGQVGPSDHFGNYITIEYSFQGYHFFATYMHLQDIPDVLKIPNATVDLGVLIGHTGDTGGVQAHLHVTYGNAAITYTNGSGTTSLIADGSTPQTEQGSPNTNGTPVYFFAGVMSDQLHRQVDNAQPGQGPHSADTITGGAVLDHASLSASGSNVVVTNSITDKIFDVLKDVGEVVVSNIHDLFVGNLNGTSLLRHTVYYDGTADADVLNALAADTDVVAWGGLGDDRLLGGSGDDVLVGGPAGSTGNAAATTAAPQTLTLQPGPEGQDEWVTNVYYGGGQDDNRLRIGGWGDEYDALVRFDLAGSGLPAHVTSATLRLYNVSANGGTPTGFTVDELHTSWDENYRWHDRDLVGTTIGQVAAPGIGWVDVNVTQAVNDWLADPSSNFGLRLAPLLTSNNFDFFVSSDATGDEAAERPQLVLAFDNAGPSTDNDYLDGGAGNDTLDGGGGFDTLLGGDGADRLIVGAGGDGTVVDGGADTDTLVVTGAVTLGGLTGVEGIEFQSGGALTLSASQFTTGLAPNATLSGAGALTINMGAGDGVLYLQQMVGGSGVTITVNGSADSELIKGAVNAVNIINGGDGSDAIRGSTQIDTLNGGNGDDKIEGGMAADILTGGSGADTFRYQSASASTVAAPDKITDFVPGTDKLGFLLLDSDPNTPGIQGFSYIDTQAFHHTGAAEIRYETSGADLTVQVDINGDGIADMAITLLGLGGGSLGSGDFLI